MKQEKKIKIICIPINEDLHWTLCVIVNTWKIAKAKIKNKKRASIYFILYLLKAHGKLKVKQIVLIWLNSEAKLMK